MDVMTYSDFRSNLARTIDRVNDNHKPVLVTRQNGKPAVLMSVEDYNAFQETAYLMASPKNAQRLSEAIHQIESGQSTDHGLIDE